MKEIELLKKSPVSREVEKRIKEFEKLSKMGWKDLFSELCFCILTANFKAEKCMEIQEKIGKNGFLELSYGEIVKILKEFGHRFPHTRAKYIVEARKFARDLEKIKKFRSGKEAREWVVKIKGLGMKEASHFLRNIGFKDVAIIDRHILKFLSEKGIIKKPKSLSRKKYLEIEKKLEGIAKKLDLDLARLDLYIWYLKTGKVLK